jgi:hypothetical protein
MSYKMQAYKPKTRYIPKHKSPEKSVQLQACSYLRLQWPNVIFRSDYASGLKLSMHQAVTHKAMQSSRSFPDMFLYKPMKIAGRQYAGAAFELKKEGISIIVKIGPRKGQLVADPHIREQYLMLQELDKLGYYTDFCIGIDDFIRKANWYLSGGLETPENASLVF